MKRTDNSLDKEFATYGCSSRSYCLVIKKDSQQGFHFSSFQNQRQKLKTGGTWWKDNMAKMILWSKKMEHKYAQNNFMLQIYKNPWQYTTLPNKGKLSKITFIEYFWRRKEQKTCILQDITKEENTSRFGR